MYVKFAKVVLTMISKICVNGLFLFSFSLIIVLTLLYPMPTSIGTTKEIGLANNFIPFFVIRELITLYPFSYSMYNIIGNIMLFVPLGFILPIKFKRINNCVRDVLVGFIFSVFVELAQLILPFRQTDIDDVMLNTVGTAIGYGLYKLWTKVVRKKAIKYKK